MKHHSLHPITKENKCGANSWVKIVVIRSLLSGQSTRSQHSDHGHTNDSIGYSTPPMWFCFWLTFGSRGAQRLCLCGGCSQNRMLHTPFVVPGIVQDWAGWCNALAAGASDWFTPSNANSRCSGSVGTMPTSQIAPEEYAQTKASSLEQPLQLNVGVRGKAADRHKRWLHKTKLPPVNKSNRTAGPVSQVWLCHGSMCWLLVKKKCNISKVRLISEPGWCQTERKGQSTHLLSLGHE